MLKFRTFVILVSTCGITTLAPATTVEFLHDEDTRLEEGYACSLTFSESDEQYVMITEKWREGLQFVVNVEKSDAWWKKASSDLTPMNMRVLITFDDGNRFVGSAAMDDYRWAAICGNYSGHVSQARGTSEVDVYN